MKNPWRRSRRARRSRPVFFVALTMLAMTLAPAARAFSLNRNGAHIKWKSSETEHFRFTYPEGIEPAAEYIAGIAESVADEKLKRYRITFPNKVEMIIREDIFSNGWANSLQNTMTVWISDWDFPIRSTHDWLRDVVTHEFSHLVSIQSSSKFPSPIQGLVLGYQDYFNEPVQASAATIIPFTAQPNWFAEGVAQYESEFSGFDAWDSHRDMILRVASQEDKLLSYDRMGTFTGTSIEYEQGPYTQGFAFVKFIAARYGDAAMLKLWAENARLYRQTLSGSMERVLGKTGEEVWKEWKSAATAGYAEQVKALGTPVQGKKLTSKGFYNYYPRWDSKGENIFFVSNRGRDDFKGSLYRYKLADSAKKEDERIKLMDGGIRSPFTVLGDDSTVLFHTAREADKDGMHKFDVFQRKTGRKPGFFEFGKDKTELRYTKEMNAIMPSYDREGKRIVFVRNRLTNFQLCTAPVPETGKPDFEDVKTIWPSDSALDGRFGFNIYSPRFSPDGKSIAFSYYDGVSRNIGIVNTDGSGFQPLLARPYDERDPEWAPDGRSLFFSADSGGIYNIYRRDLASGALEALTRVVGGAFVPTVDPSGKRLAYVNYDKDGFSLYVLPDLKPAGSAAVASHALHPDHEKIEPIDLAGKAEKYLGIPNRYILNPILFGEEMSARTRKATRGEPKWLGGVNGLVNDPVFKNEVSGALLFELGNGIDYFGANDEILSPDKESQFYLAWGNNALPVSLGASFSRGNLVTHDTITVRNAVGGTGDDADQKVNNNYAVTFRDAEASLSYDLFDPDAVGEDYKTSFLRLAAGLSWNDFNFYESSYKFEYYKNTYVSALLNFYSSTYSDKELIAPHGLAAALGYTYNHSGIIRRGSFLETFDFSDGFLKTKFRFYDLHDLDLGATYGTGLFWADNGALLVSGFVGSILDWKHTNKDTAADTLDTFFSKGMFLRGYPYLRDVENLAFQGENVAKMSAEINQPLLPDIYRGYWVLFVEDLYLNLFWEAGRAWNGKLDSPRLFSAAYWDPGRRSDGWFQSAGWGLKLNARIYHNYPFLAYFEAATALSGVPDGKGGLEPLRDIKIKLGNDTRLDTYATRISFGVSFGLYNGLLGGGAGAPAAVKNPLRHNAYSHAR